MKIAHLRAAVSVALLAASSPLAAAGRLDPLVRVSGGSPFIACEEDSIQDQPGTVYLNSEVEPWIVVNPVDPLNVVGVWQQDRWSNIGARGLVVGTSGDGGRTFRWVPVPSLTLCRGGDWTRATDPWLSFSPDGDLFLLALVLRQSPPRQGMTVSRSIDGGLTWSFPRLLVDAAPPVFHDKGSITADPYDSRFIYAAWDALDALRLRGPLVFTRSTNGGVSWEPIRTLHDPGAPGQTFGAQILVLPAGALATFFTEISRGGYALGIKWSDDKGVHWFPPDDAWRAFRMFPLFAVDPDTRLPVRDGHALFDVAIDPGTGAVYAVWQDGRPGHSRFPSILFSMSGDRGATWSPPAAINRTPADLPDAARQAFTPSIHVSDTGMIGVSYYDFRFSAAGPGGADRWLVWCHPRAADCTRADRWREEFRLTEVSFDITRAPYQDGYFLGDYAGLTSAGADFVPLFGAPHDDDPASLFLRRVVPLDTVEPQGIGWWRRQVDAALSDRGHGEVPATDLLEFLADIRVLYPFFSAVEGLEGLRAAIAPPFPGDLRGRAARHTLGSLLNLTSSRISPSARVRGEETVVEVLAQIAGVLADPSATPAALKAATDTAEALNEGIIPLPEPGFSSR